MFARKLLVVSMLLLWAGSLAAERPVLRAPEGADFGRFPGDESTRILARTNGIVLRTLTAREREAARSARPQGGGAAVENLVVVQFAFSDPTVGNACALFWDELPGNEDTAIFIDGGLLGTVGGPGAGPGGIAINGIPAGIHEFAVLGLVAGAGDGDPSLFNQDVLDAQPFSDVSNLECSSESINPDGTCDLVATFDNPGPLPAAYSVFIDGIFLGQIPGDATGFGVVGLPAGEYLVEVFGVSTLDGSNYLGATVGDLCVLSCVEVPALGVWGLAALLCGVLGLGAFALRTRRVEATA